MVLYAALLGRAMAGEPGESGTAPAAGEAVEGRGLAACSATYETSDILDAAKTAEGYFSATDLDSFRSTRAAMERRLTCSRDLLSPAALARVERVEALGAFADGNRVRIPQALAGLFIAEPGHQIPIALVPEGHPVRDAITAAMLALHDDLGAPIPKPASGWVEVDGAFAEVAPTQRAAVLQQVDKDGAVVATHLRWPDEAGFDWMVGPTSAGAAASPRVAKSIAKPVASASGSAAGNSTPSKSAATTPPTPPSAKAKSPALPTASETRAASSADVGQKPWSHRAPLLATSLAAGIASGVLLGLASASRAEFDAQPVLDPETPQPVRTDYRAQLEGIQTQTNTFALGGYVSGGVGLALGLVTVVTW